MPACLEINGELFWGTNGMVEACLDAFEQVATIEYGMSDPIVPWCQLERAKFFPGGGVVLDPIITSASSIARITHVIAKSMLVLKRDFALTEVGLRWVDEVLPKVIDALAKQKT